MSLSVDSICSSFSCSCSTCTCSISRSTKSHCVRDLCRMINDAAVWCLQMIYEYFFKSFWLILNSMDKDHHSSVQRRFLSDRRSKWKSFHSSVATAVKPMVEKSTEMTIVPDPAAKPMPISSSNQRIPLALSTSLHSLTSIFNEEEFLAKYVFIRPNV